MKKTLAMLFLLFAVNAHSATVQGDADSNGALDINRGGTNSTSAANARTALGVPATAATLVGDCTVGPCLDGSSDGGNLIKLYAGTGSYWTALQSGVPAANRSWRLPIAAPPSAGETLLMTMDEYGQMGFLAKPSTSGYVLSSTNTGVLSWVESGTGAGDDLGSATYSDVVALWTTCSGYLKSDGTCDTPSGSATYPSSAGVVNWTGSAWGTSYTLDTDLTSVSANDDTIPSAKATKALFDSIPAITWGTGLTNNSNTISVTNPVTAEAFSGSGWNGDTEGLTRNDAYDYLVLADTDVDGLPNKLDLSTAGLVSVDSSGVVSSGATLPSATIIPDSGTLTFDESADDPNDADIQLSATDGVLKIAAVNGANNEDLTLDLDATANKAKFNSGSGLTLITTGSIPFTGAIRTVGKDADYTIGADDADEAYGSFFVNTGASTRTFTLPSAVAGMSVCVRNGQGVSQILRLDANTDDYIVKSSGARTSAAAEYYGATADAKNQLCVVAYDSTNWYVTSEVGTWTEE